MNNQPVDTEVKTRAALEPLLSEGEIERRVGQLAEQLAKDYAGRDLLVVGVLKGAFIFLADLLRRLNKLGLNPQVDFIRAASYGADTRSSGWVKVFLDVSLPVEGRDVLVVDDIVDSGRTLGHICERLRGLGAASVRCCVLLDKPARREVPFHPDYVGFEIPDRFVVGYGLDKAELWRGMPDIAMT